MNNRYYGPTYSPEMDELKKQIEDLKREAKDDADYIKSLEMHNRQLKSREKIRIDINKRLKTSYLDALAKLSKMRHELDAANERLEYLEERPQPKTSLELLIEEKIDEALRARDRRCTLEDIRMGARY